VALPAKASIFATNKVRPVQVPGESYGHSPLVTATMGEVTVSSSLILDLCLLRF